MGLKKNGGMASTRTPKKKPAHLTSTNQALREEGARLEGRGRTGGGSARAVKHGSALCGLGACRLMGAAVQDGVQSLQSPIAGVGYLSAHKLRDPRVADVGRLSNPRPIAAAAVKFSLELLVKFGVHADSIAIFCECGKQHIANCS